MSNGFLLKRVLIQDAAPFLVKAGSGFVNAVRAFNINAAPRYLKFYDKATAPTVGTDTPIDVVGIPGNTSGGGNNASMNPGPPFFNGLWCAVTTGILDSDTGAPTANQVLVSVIYG